MVIMSMTLLKILVWIITTVVGAILYRMGVSRVYITMSGAGYSGGNGFVLVKW